MIIYVSHPVDSIIFDQAKVKSIHKRPEYHILLVSSTWVEALKHPDVESGTPPQPRI